MEDNAQGDVATQSIISHACSSAKSAAGSACVCRLATMETKPFVLATTTGRQRKEDPNALKKTPIHFAANSISFVSPFKEMGLCYVFVMNL